MDDVQEPRIALSKITVEELYEYKKAVAKYIETESLEIYDTVRMFSDDQPFGYRVRILDLMKEMENLQVLPPFVKHLYKITDEEYNELYLQYLQKQSTR